MSAFTRMSPMLRQRLFSTSTRARTAISIQDVTAAQLSSATSSIPRLGRVAKWYLPTMAAIALGFGITNALNDANRQVHQAQEPTQEQRNLMLMDLYGERSTLADMERAMAGLEKRLSTQTQRNAALEEAYGDRATIKDLQRAMQLYEVQ